MLMNKAIDPENNIQHTDLHTMTNFPGVNHFLAIFDLGVETNFHK